MNLVNIFNSNHVSTKRDYLGRMSNGKVQNMEIASRYGYEYWDGDRATGYGGYHYDGRYKTIAEEIIKKYSLNEQSRVLDFGCGKGFILFEIYNLVKCDIVGIDISDYAILNAKEEVKSF